MCGQTLGSQGPAQCVDASFSVPEKPTFWQKITFKAPSSQQQKVSIYVCCPECAARAQGDPAGYLVKVIQERGGGL